MKNQILITTIMTLLCAYVSNINAQVGQEFWFVAPEVTDGHTDRPIFLRISSQGTACTVTISQPANTAFTALSVSLTANETQSVDLTTWIDNIESALPDTVLHTGLLITATADITVYYEVRSSGDNPDIFALKGDNALGTNFFITAQSFWENGITRYPDAYRGFLVVASEDNTQVIITPAADIEGHLAGVPFTITLDKGETYYARSISRTQTGHLGGSEVLSTKPIAITIADDSITNSTYGGCNDLAGDQTIPINMTGTEYIVVKGFLIDGGTDLDDKVYVLATEDSTSIYLNGSGVADYTLSRGEQQEISLSDAVLYINSDKNIYVMHVTGFGCEVGMAVLPSMYCTGTTGFNITRSTSEDFYLLLLVPNGSEDDFRWDGNTGVINAADFNVVTGTGGNWHMARLGINAADLAVGATSEVTNLTSRFHLGVINGGKKTGCMYGYFSDFNEVNTNPIYHN